MKKRIVPLGTFTRHIATIFCCLLLLVIVCGKAEAITRWPHMVSSQDGTPISYEIYGHGDPTLIFVHGWSCDGRYWRAQVPFFSKKYQVVVLDLAGHGHSGLNRTVYTMAAFGEDVKAVADMIGSNRVILIGHSMGGSVIAEAARLMPERVIGLIGVDTLENIETPMTPDAGKKMMAPFEKDFPAGCRQFVGDMILPKTDPRLRHWILSDMSSAPPAVAMSGLKEMIAQFITGEAARIFDQVRVPVMSVNGSLWPVNFEANRRHMLSYDAIVLNDADHFLMMDKPRAFNHALKKAIKMILKKSAEGKDK